MAKPFFANLLRCADDAYYVGHTDDLTRRVAEHQEGGRCAYTTTRRPVALVWSAAFSTREAAKLMEDRIKGWSRAKKAALARGDVASLRLAARKDWARHRRRGAAAEDPE